MLDIIPKANTEDDEKGKDQITKSSLEASKQFGKHKMFKESVTQIMRTKIKNGSEA